MISEDYLEHLKRRNAMIYEYEKDFEDAGFGEHCIDFSSVSPELIKVMGEAIRSYFKGEA